MQGIKVHKSLPEKVQFVELSQVRKVQSCYLDFNEEKRWENYGDFFCAGGISAFLTTPLDVAKTRIMLADSSSIEAEGNVFVVWRIIFAQNGFRG